MILLVRHRRVAAGRTQLVENRQRAARLGAIVDSEGGGMLLVFCDDAGSTLYLRTLVTILVYLPLIGTS